jgi:glycosyltransferase involved in cell wall biosynthesis
MGSAAPLTVVICVDHASVTGGQAKVAFDSARGLKAAGHRPILFAAAGPVSPELEESGIETICLDQADLLGNESKIAAAVQGVWNAKAARELAGVLASCPRGSTVVHVHGWAKALSPSIASPISASGLPAVYTIHEYFLFCPNGGFYDYQGAHVCALKPLSGACWATHCDSISYPRKLWRNMRLALAKGVVGLPSVFDDFICISELQEQIVRPYLPSGAEVHRVSNPVAVETLGPKSAPAQGDFVFVGRISPEKGPLLFAEAARRAGVKAVFVGDGPMKAQLAAAYPEADIRGWVAPEAARAALREARALVFPSLWYEGQPLTVLEAKGLGTPVIVSDVCAGREAIQPGVSGLWFKAGDVDSLVSALTTMKHDRTVATMARAAYDDYWREPPTLDAHVRRIEKIYRDRLAATA